MVKIKSCTKVKAKDYWDIVVVFINGEEWSGTIPIQSEADLKKWITKLELKLYPIVPEYPSAVYINDLEWAGVYEKTCPGCGKIINKDATEHSCGWIQELVTE